MTAQQLTVGKPRKKKRPFHITYMVDRDLPEVSQIEQLSFEYAWNEEDFRRCKKQQNCRRIVAQRGEKIVGFMVYEIHQNKLHIINFAVHPAWRRQGVGEQMVDWLVKKLPFHRRLRITLEVRETNLPAQLFFREQSFRGTRVLRAFCEDSGEDAFLMEYHLIAANRITQYFED